MSAFSLLLPHLRPRWPLLLAAGACVLGGALATAGLVPLARYAGEAFGALELGALNMVVGALVGLYALKSAFMFAQAALAARVALDATAGLREQAFAHLLTQDLRFHARERSTELASRLVQDLAVLREALCAVVADMAPSVLIILYALGAVFVINWRLALFTLVGVPLVGWAIAAFGARLARLAAEVQQRAGDVVVTAQESLSAMTVVKAFGREDAELARFRRANRAHLGAHWNSALVASLQPSVIAVVQTLALGAVLWVGGYEITQGRLSGAELLAFAAAIGIAVDPTLALSQGWAKFQAASGATERLRALLSADERLSEAVGAPPLGAVAGALACEDVCFAYAEGAPVLKGVSFEIAPGEAVALVGPSGGGKSTLAHLLLRLYDPTSGRVTLDGRDMRDVPSADLRRVVAYVAQEPFLFAASVADNVAFGKPGADRAAIEAACRAANAHDFVTALSEGYDTPLGERGAGLSGGQRQRLAIARALLADPRVLILDEATSALDSEAEEAVKEAVARLMAGRTTLIIAHRLSAIERADRVLLLQDGRLSLAGTPAELLARDGMVRRLLEAADAGVTSVTADEASA